jgi:hypothetical protein
VKEKAVNRTRKEKTLLESNLTLDIHIAVR